MNLPLRPGRILLIDDNKHGLLVRKVILRDLGYEVETAENGELGLQRFRDCAEYDPFDLVITNYRMPGIQGQEVITRLKELAPELPVVLLSGYTEQLALAAESTGANVVLAKGAREQYELAETVLRLLPDGAKTRGKPMATETTTSTGRPLQLDKLAQKVLISNG